MISDPYFDLGRNVERLLKNYEEHNTLIVAFDFDNTIFDFENKKYEYPKVVDILLDCQNRGFKLILFTASPFSRIMEICEYCRNVGILDFYVNESPVNPYSRKPYYNILLDDRAGLSEAYKILKETIKLIERSKINGS